MYVQNTHIKIGSIPSSEPVVSTKEPSVLVVQVCTSEKEYCRLMYPKFYNTLIYGNKYAYFISEKEYPELNRQPSFDQKMAYGRQIGINIARKLNIDWLFFMDIDVEPDPSCIEKMLSLNYPLVGCLNAYKDDAYCPPGHNYVDRKDLYKTWLGESSLKNNPIVDFISSEMLLIAKGIYCRIDYTGYVGLQTIPARSTTEDEFFQIKIYNSFKIRPKVASNVKNWHYNDDGRAYRLWGDIKTWRPA